MGENKEERRKREERAQIQREHLQRARERARGVSAEVRAQLPPAWSGSEDTISRLLDSGQPIRLIVEPNGIGGATFTCKTVLALSTHSIGVYMHGRVKDEADVSEALRRCLEKGDWRTDKYWKP